MDITFRKAKKIETMSTKLPNKTKKTKVASKILILPPKECQDSQSVSQKSDKK